MDFLSGVLLFCSGILVGIFVGLYVMAWSTVTHIKSGGKPYIDHRGKHKVLKWTK